MFSLYTIHKQDIPSTHSITTSISKSIIPPNLFLCLIFFFSSLSSLQGLSIPFQKYLKLTQHFILGIAFFPRSYFYSCSQSFSQDFKGQSLPTIFFFLNVLYWSLIEILKDGDT